MIHEELSQDEETLLMSKEEQVKSLVESNEAQVLKNQ